MFLRHFYNKSRNYFENLRRKSIKSCKKKVKKPYIIMYKAVTEPAHIQACIKLLGKGKGWGSRRAPNGGKRIQNARAAI